jgi:hypothetical protein
MTRLGKPVGTHPAPAANLARALLLLGGLTLGACAHSDGARADRTTPGPWRPLFDTRTLDGWTPKVAGHPVGENYRQTFMVDHGAIRVTYAGYGGQFKNQFGHLFYKAPFKAYRLRLTYRFLDPSLPDTPKWARSNSGVMFHSQSPESMTVDQPFPVSIEFQLLGRDGDGPRPTGAVCTPGLNISFDGVRAKDHCTPPVNAPTITNGTWTKVELEVLPNGEVSQKVNGVVVEHYAGLELDPDDTIAAGAKPYITARIAAQGGALALTGGYIALQSEGQPVEFKDIEIQELTAGR